MSELSTEKKVSSTESPVYDSEIASTPVRRNAFQRFGDSFKPAHIPAHVTEGLTEEEIRVAMTEHAPLKRGLKARHLSMLAIGGSIGSGLFIGSGNSFASGGPAGVIISFTVVGIMLYAVMQCLGELAVQYPVQGAFYIYAQRFMDRSWGFALGWNYALQWMTTLPLELIAAAILIDYWNGDNNGATNVNKAAWVGLFYAVILFINIFGVKGYGESEFAFSMLKVIAVVGFCIFGIIAICGKVGPTYHYYGTDYWHHPGAFANGFKGVCTCFINAAFAFSGSEMAGLAAGETDNPAKTLPRAIKQVFWRIMLFYVGSLTIVSFLVPYDNEHFGTTSDGRSSPFVIAIANTGVNALPSIFNVVILISALSVANTSVYGSSRTLTALACEGQAPKIFGYIDRQGRPLFSIFVTMLFGLLGFLVASDKYQDVFNWLLAFSGLSVILTYLSICWCHIRFRQALKYNNIPVSDLAFSVKGGIWVPLFGIVLCVIILALQFWIALWPIGEKPNAEAFFEIYLGLPVVLFFYVCHKIYFRTPFYIKVEDMDLKAGIRDEQLQEQLQQARNWNKELSTKSWPVRFYYTWC